MNANDEKMKCPIQINRLFWKVMGCCANANVSPFQMPESQA